MVRVDKNTNMQHFDRTNDGKVNMHDEVTFSYDRMQVKSTLYTSYTIDKEGRKLGVYYVQDQAPPNQCYRVTMYGNVKTGGAAKTISVVPVSRKEVVLSMALEMMMDANTFLISSDIKDFIVQHRMWLIEHMLKDPECKEPVFDSAIQGNKLDRKEARNKVVWYLDHYQEITAAEEKTTDTVKKQQNTERKTIVVGDTIKGRAKDNKTFSGKVYRINYGQADGNSFKNMYFMAPDGKRYMATILETGRGYDDLSSAWVKPAPSDNTEVVRGGKVAFMYKGKEVHGILYGMLDQRMQSGGKAYFVSANGKYYKVRCREAWCDADAVLYPEKNAVSELNEQDFRYALLEQDNIPADIWVEGKIVSKVEKHFDRNNDPRQVMTTRNGKKVEYWAAWDGSVGFKTDMFSNTGTGLSLRQLSDKEAEVIYVRKAPEGYAGYEVVSQNAGLITVVSTEHWAYTIAATIQETKGSTPNNRSYVENKVLSLIESKDFKGFNSFYKECTEYGFVAVANFEGAISKYVKDINGFLLRDQYAPDEQVSDYFKRHTAVLGKLKELIYITKADPVLNKMIMNAVKKNLEPVFQDWKVDWGDQEFIQLRSKILALFKHASKEELKRFRDMFGTGDEAAIHSFIVMKLDVPSMWYTAVLRAGGKHMFLNMAKVLYRDLDEHIKALDARAISKAYDDIGQMTARFCAAVFDSMNYIYGNTYGTGWFSSIADHIDDLGAPTEAKRIYAQQLNKASKDWSNLTSGEKEKVFKSFYTGLDPQARSLLLSSLPLKAPIDYAQMDLIPVMLVSTNGSEELSYFIGYKDCYVNLTELEMNSNSVYAQPVYKGPREHAIEQFLRTTPIVDPYGLNRVIVVEKNGRINVHSAELTRRECWKVVSMGLNYGAILGTLILGALLAAETAGASVAAATKITGAILVGMMVVSIQDGVVKMYDKHENRVLTDQEMAKGVTDTLISLGFLVPIGGISGTIFRSVLMIPGTTELIETMNDQNLSGQEKYVAFAQFSLMVGLMAHAEAGNLRSWRVRRDLKRLGIGETPPAGGGKVQVSWLQKKLQNLMKAPIDEKKYIKNLKNRKVQQIEDRANLFMKNKNNLERYKEYSASVGDKEFPFYFDKEGTLCLPPKDVYYANANEKYFEWTDTRSEFYKQWVYARRDGRAGHCHINIKNSVTYDATKGDAGLLIGTSQGKMKYISKNNALITLMARAYSKKLRVYANSPVTIEKFEKAIDKIIAENPKYSTYYTELKEKLFSTDIKAPGILKDAEILWIKNNHDPKASSRLQLIYEKNGEYYLLRFDMPHESNKYHLNNHRIRYGKHTYWDKVANKEKCETGFFAEEKNNHIDLTKPTDTKKYDIDLIAKELGIENKTKQNLDKIYTLHQIPQVVFGRHRINIDGDLQKHISEYQQTKRITKKMVDDVNKAYVFISKISGTSPKSFTQETLTDAGLKQAKRALNELRLN